MISGGIIMFFFNSHKQQNSGGTNVQTDNSIHNTTTNITILPTTKTSNSNDFAEVVIFAAVITLTLIKKLQLVFIFLQNYTSTINMCIILSSLILSTYVFFKTDKHIISPLLVFIQSGFSAILQTSLTTNDEYLNKTFESLNNIQNIFSILSDNIYGKPLLYLWLYIVSFLLLYTSIMSIWIGTLKNKSVINYYALISYFLISCFLAFGSELLNNS